VTWTLTVGSTNFLKEFVDDGRSEQLQPRKMGSRCVRTPPYTGVLPLDPEKLVSDPFYLH